MMSTSAQRKIALRLAENADQAFLTRVFASAHQTLLAEIEDPLRSQLLQMQFAGQQMSYRSRYPEAEDLIVECKGKSVGRLFLAENETAMTILDLAILPAFQRQGIGYSLMNGLQEKARETGKKIRLSVVKGNPAVQFYEKSGFSCVGEDEFRFEMSWPSELQ